MKKNNNAFPVPNELSEKTKASLAVRVATALIGTIIVLPSIFVGDFFYFALITILVAFASHEIIVTAKGKSHPILVLAVGLFTLFLTLAPLAKYLFSNPDFSTFRIYDAFGDFFISFLGIAIAAVLLFFLVIFNPNIELKDGAMVFFMVIVVSLGFQSLLFIRFLPAHLFHVANPDAPYWNLYCNFQSSTLLVYVAIAALFTDIGAYLIGIFFGKHKMNPRISPSKTWEGFWGGILVSFVCSFSFCFFLSLGGFPPLPGVFDLDHWYLIVLFSLITPFLSVIGDLAFSSIKRVYGIKDYGQILPGHGGILDRVDSVLIVSLFASLFISFVLTLTSGGNPII